MKSNAQADPRKRTVRKNPDTFKTMVLTKLRRLEEEIPKLKAKKREKALETYQKLLWFLKDEPIFLARYE